MRRPAGLAHRFFQHAGGLAIPTIVLAELYGGAYKHDNAPRLLALIADLTEEITVLDFDQSCAEVFGKIYGELSRTGKKTPVVDLMIAAIALVHDKTLVTNNTADFEQIPGLRLDNWLEP